MLQLKIADSEFKGKIVDWPGNDYPRYYRMNIIPKGVVPPLSAKPSKIIEIEFQRVEFRRCDEHGKAIETWFEYFQNPPNSLQVSQQQ